jgi:hypothetical protein
VQQKVSNRLKIQYNEFFPNHVIQFVAPEPQKIDSNIRGFGAHKAKPATPHVFSKSASVNTPKIP